MSLREATITKIEQMPEPLVQEVHDFAEFLLLRSNQEQWRTWQEFRSETNIAESDMTDYLANLEDYEERLARGEIQW
jgi:hypothetical protein